jgi:hypothetical protein
LPPDPKPANPKPYALLKPHPDNLIKLLETINLFLKKIKKSPESISSPQNQPSRIGNLFIFKISFYWHCVIAWES